MDSAKNVCIYVHNSTYLIPPAVGCCKNGEGTIGDIGGIVVDIGVFGVEPDPLPLDILSLGETSHLNLLWQSVEKYIQYS